MRNLRITASNPRTGVSVRITRALYVTAGMFAFAACAGETSLTQPTLAASLLEPRTEPTAPTMEPAEGTSALDRHVRFKRQLPIAAFAEAQGTWCGEFGSERSCKRMARNGIGFLPNSSGSTSPFNLAAGTPYYSFDPGGVHARYWAAHHLAPELPAYAVTGSVEESQLADGRRFLKITLDAVNTFVTYVDADLLLSLDADVLGPRGSKVIFGADFSEYPGVDDNIVDQIPALATVHADMELVLPADFVGMPDLAEMFYAATPGMEIRLLSAVVTAEGPLQSSFGGMSPGTNVQLIVRDSFADYVVPTTAFMPPHVTLTRLGEMRRN